MEIGQSKHDLPPHQVPGGSGSDLPEVNTHSFIIKIWLEEIADSHGPGKWRGRITHVPSTERRYLKSLAEIPDFIVPYLEAMHVKIEIYWRVRQWAKHWTLSLKRKVDGTDKL